MSSISLNFSLPSMTMASPVGSPAKKRETNCKEIIKQKVSFKGVFYSVRAAGPNLVRSREADARPQMRLQRPFHCGARSWAQNRRGIDRAGLKCGIDHYGIYRELRESCCCGLVRPCLFSVARRRWGNASPRQLERTSRKGRKQKSRPGPRRDCRGGK